MVNYTTHFRPAWTLLRVISLTQPIIDYSPLSPEWNMYDDK